MRYLFLLLFLAPVSVIAQYKIVAPAYNCNDKISASEMPYWHVIFKNDGVHIHLYEKIKDSLRYVRYSLKKLNLKTGKIDENLKLPQIPTDFMITDIIADKGYTIFIGQSKLIFFYENKNAKLFSRKNADFSSGHKLNDSLILLYQIYNYHPADGQSGIHMSVFNTRQQSFVTSVVYPFPAVGMGHMNLNWVTYSKDAIYAFCGLTGDVFKYDFNLKEIDHYDTHIFPDSTKSKNVAYQHYNDSLIAIDYKEIMAVLPEIKAYNDTAKVKRRIISKIWSKDFMSETSKTVRSQYSFIEKVFKVSDEEVLLSLRRPDKPLTRDLFLYNLKLNTVRLQYANWKSGKQKQLFKPEDYYTVDIENSAPIAPIFYRDVVYSLNVYDIKKFEPGLSDVLDQIQHQEVIKNGYQWQLTKYSLSPALY